MATYRSETKNYYTLRLDVNETGTSVTNNTSTLSWKLYVETGATYFSEVRIGAKVVIDGTTVINRSYSASGSGPFECDRNSSELIASGTTTVTHGSDGTKTIAAGAITASINTQTGNIVPNLSLANGKALKLTDISRASTMVLPSSGDIGSSITIGIERESDSFTHTLKYSFAGTTGTIVTKTTSTSYSWTIPASLASKLTNAKSGTLTISCQTFSGDTSVGTTTGTLFAYIPASSLSFSPATVTMGNEQTINITRIATNITHKLTYSIGSASGTIGTGVGTKITWTVPKSLAAQIASPASSGDVTVRMVTYNGTAVCGSTVVQTFTAKIPASSFTISASAINVGSDDGVTISISRAASNLVHTIQWSKDETFQTGINSLATKTTATSYTWKPAYSFGSNISGTSEQFYIRVVTYNGSSAGTSVGNEVLPLTIRVPNNSSTRPTITWDSTPVQPYPALGSPFADYYVQGKNGVRATFTRAAQAGASIASTEVTVDGKSVSYSASSGYATSGTFTKSGSIKVTVVITDSRGYTVTNIRTITVRPYSAPIILPPEGSSSVICARANASGTLSSAGKRLHLEVGRTISSVGGSNSGRIRFKIDNGSWIIPDGGAYATTVTKYITPYDSSSDVFETTKTYTVTIEAADNSVLGGVTTMVVTIPSAEINLHLRRYGNGIGIGQYSQDYKTLQISPEWGVQGRVYGLGWLPRITSGSVNDYYTPGRYAIFTTDKDSISDLPAGVANQPYGGVLTVISSSGNAYSDIAAQTNVYFIQEFRTLDGSYEWERLIYINASGSWVRGGWRRLYPQPNASTVSLTYSSNSIFSDLSGFSLYQSGVNCILYVNAAPAAVAVTSFTTVGTIPEGARPNAAVVQNSNAQNSTSFVEVAIRLGTDGNIQLYSPGTQTSRIQMVIPYFTNL